MLQLEGIYGEVISWRFSMEPINAIKFVYYHNKRICRSVLPIDIVLPRVSWRAPGAFSFTYESVHDF
jgi:hypothetical protein